MADNGGDRPDQRLTARYTTLRLELFKELVDDILDELTSMGDYLFESSPHWELEILLGAAVFRCAQSGERDYAHLRRRVLEEFNTPASWRRFISQ